MTDILLEVRDLTKHFPVANSLITRHKRFLSAVDDVSFVIRTGEIFGLVGESGCGKSTIGKLIVRLLNPTHGKILFGDENIFQLKGTELMRMRRNIQIVFQNPYSSLDPRWTVERILSEPMITHKLATRSEMRERVAELLVSVGMDPDYMYRYPHMFSGGQRQRIGLARALAVHPRLLVADEPVSALDVSIQAQILNLMQSLQQKFDLSMLFISHNLSVMRYLSDRVGVMYLGKLVEVAPVEELFNAPRHPYTQALLSAIPVADLRRKKEQIILEGEVPSPINPPSGCRFRTRCLFAMDICAKINPVLIDIGNDHQIACHLVTPPIIAN